MTNTWADLRTRLKSIRNVNAEAYGFMFLTGALDSMATDGRAITAERLQTTVALAITHAETSTAEPDRAPNGDTWETYRYRMIALGYAHARIELTPETSRQDAPGPEAFAAAYAQAVNDYNATHPYPRARPNLSEAWTDYTQTGKIN